MALHPHRAGMALEGQAGLDGEGGLFNDDVAQQKNLGQNAHDQEDGDQGAPAQAHADGGDGRVGGQEPDQNTRRGQDGPRGDDGGEGLVQRLDHRVLQGHGLLQLHIAVGDDNGVVDIGPHLNGADHQIAEEEQGLIL